MNNKISNSIGLGIWIFELLYGIMKLIQEEGVNPIIFIGAVLVCILHHIGEIIRE